MAILREGDIMHAGFKHSWSLLSEERVLTDAF